MAVRALTLNGFPLIGVTPGGGQAYLKGFDGWQTRVVDRDRVKRTGRHGSSSSRGLNAARRMTLSGVIIYDDELAADAERERLAAIIASDAARLAVADDAGARWIDVDLDESEAKPRALVFTDYSFVVTADDPFKRALTPQTTPLGPGQSLFLDTAGTAAADLLVTVTSAGTVKLTAGGQTLTTTALPVGAVIDTGACEIRSAAGADLFGAVPVGSVPGWPALPPGGGTVKQAGTAGLSIVHFDTFE